MGEIVDSALQTLKTRRKRLLDGFVNCIPSPFVRFRGDFCGLEQETYYLITSYTKGGKSMFMSYTFLYENILYAYKHPEMDLDFMFLYFPLEETPERIMHRFMSHLVYRYTKGELKFSPKELRSTQKPINQDVLDVLDSDEIQDILNFFEAHVKFIDDRNPTGIYKACETYAKENGTIQTEKYNITDEWGEVETRTRFSKYIPNNPNKYIVPIIDTINLVDGERGYTQKQSIDKMSEYCKELRNKYKMSPVVIQQQAFEAERIDEFKAKNDAIRPSIKDLGDSKYTARDANIVLGLFAPARMHLHDYKGYNIDVFENNIRFLEVLINRDGDIGGLVALYFDGAVCNFKELPPPQIKTKSGDWIPNPELAKITEKVKERKEKDDNQQSLTETTLFLFGKRRKHSLFNKFYKLWQKF